jgi:hypothetical protein
MSTTLTNIAGVDVFWDGKVLSWTSGMQIDADGSPRAYGPNNSGLDYTANAGEPGNWYGIVTDENGHPIIQGPNDPCPGFYVSPTTYVRKQFKESDPKRYLNSEKIEYVVIPGKLRKMIPPVCIGCHVVATNLRTGKQVIAVCGDTGPNDKIGEGSIALALALGLNPDARHGGTDEHIIKFELYPGVPATLENETFELQAA